MSGGVDDDNDGGGGDQDQLCNSRPRPLLASFGTASSAGQAEVAARSSYDRGSHSYLRRRDFMLLRVVVLDIEETAHR